MIEETSKEVIQSIMQKQRKFFQSQITKDFDFRMTQLMSLYVGIEKHEEEIMEALKSDLGKHPTESYMMEIGTVYKSISEAIKSLKGWMTPERKKTPWYMQPAKSSIIHEPFGNTLIIAPFNYPFYLLIEPLVGAIAAGNTAVLKPADGTPNVSNAVTKMIRDTFQEEYIAIVEGGRITNTFLLEEKFDLIFFTGGAIVGRIVMEAASKNLTPVVLELGGKSPAIVDESAKIKLAAERIVFGKFSNAGQTCICPDYVFVHESKKEELLEEMSKVLQEFYGENIEESDSYGRIASDNHFERLNEIIEKDQEFIFSGGTTNRQEKYIEPTILDLKTPAAAAMDEEIFGPILPVISYRDLVEVTSFINKNEKPLAMYIFTQNKRTKEHILKSTSSGGVCINDTLQHIINPHLPFGGVGNSGMGNYHGKASFKTFSHARSVLEKYSNLTAALTNPAYNKTQLGLLRFIFK